MVAIDNRFLYTFRRINMSVSTISGFTNHPVIRSLGLATNHVWNVVKPVLQPTIDAFRIDQDIRAFYQNHSRRNFVNLGLKACELSVCFLAVYCMGMYYGIGGVIVCNFIESLGYRHFLSQFLNYFPAHNASHYIALGIASGLILGFLNIPINHFIYHQLWKMGMPITHDTQKVAVWMQSPSIGLLISLISITVGPSFEEFFFRGKLLDYFIDKQQHPSTQQEKISLVALKNFKGLIGSSLLFGLGHASPGQRWANLPIFMYQTYFGVSMSLLKLTTGNLWAPVTAHALSNAIACFITRSRVVA